MPDNGYIPKEAEVNGYMLNNDETSKRLKIRDAMYEFMNRDRKRRRRQPRRWSRLLVVP